VIGPEKSNGPIESLDARARSLEGEPPDEPRRNPARTEPRPPGITQDRLTKKPEQDRPRHSENGASQAQRQDLRLLSPVARALEDREKRERLRLPSGGLVWIAADGSPLTEDVVAALAQQDLRCQVIRLSEERGRLTLRVDRTGSERAAHVDIRQGRVPSPTSGGPGPTTSRDPRLWLLCNGLAARWRFWVKRTRTGIEPGPWCTRRSG
jgi:hypothetical protein